MSLTKDIQGKQHVLVEGWTLLGSMLGVFPVTVWTQPVENGWEARVEARTIDGKIVGAAEAQCTRDERLWKTRDDYALRSMAQTRATSKALRQPLGFVMTLAGFEATPEAEMPGVSFAWETQVPIPDRGISLHDLSLLVAERNRLEALGVPRVSSIEAPRLPRRAHRTAARQRMMASGRTMGSGRTWGRPRDPAAHPGRLRSPTSCACLRRAGGRRPPARAEGPRCPQRRPVRRRSRGRVAHATITPGGTVREASRA
jgi:hypothetical protein